MISLPFSSLPSSIHVGTSDRICDALRTSDRNCDSSSCGNIQNIRYPFRFEGDPENCGNKRYELACHNNRPLLDLSSAGDTKYYYVQAINYNNYTIRVVDMGIQNGSCSSLPLYSLSFENFTGPAFNFDYYNSYGSYNPNEFQWKFPCFEAVAVLVECENPVNSPLYMNTSSTTYTSCINKSSSSHTHYYSYFLFRNLRASDVADLCRIDEIVATTLWSPLPPTTTAAAVAASYNFSINFMEFHAQLASGFELSWAKILCENCSTGGSCFIDPTTNYTVTCYNYCDSQIKLTFLCALELIYSKHSLFLIHNYFIIYNLAITSHFQPNFAIPVFCAIVVSSQELKFSCKIFSNLKAFNQKPINSSLD
ncbi:uncharacterized protein LOC114293295 isoform X1 [Camellia sinensis]|uniref:uncharacterized protein LOC114293295 isoform X1 n=1 Tax=Camellia sinensis TaxID=4442 RepID=UPI001036BA83|nr:uncharacterized protein LOC114293295 isoform X1 [Camellia sinensis]